MSLRLITTTIFLLTAFSAYAERTLIDLEQVEKISQRVWETKNSSALLRNSMEELCRSASEEVWIRGNYIETSRNDSMLKRCRTWSEKNQAKNKKERVLFICEKFAPKKMVSYSYLDEDQAQMVYDSRELDCLERGAHLLKLESASMNCRKKGNESEENLLPKSRGGLQRVVECNKKLLK